MDPIAFYIFAAIAVLASLGVIGQRNPMHSVMLLIASFGALAGLYILLDAPFTAVTQIIIYAGAIMVLFLFVVMLLNAQREERHRRMAADRSDGLKIGVVLSLLLAVEVVWALSRRRRRRWFSGRRGRTRSSSVAQIGTRCSRRTPSRSK